MSLTLTNISHKLENGVLKPMSFHITATSCYSLVVGMLYCKSQGPRFNSQNVSHLALFAEECVVYVYFYCCMVWHGIVCYTQVENS